MGGNRKIWVPIAAIIIICLILATGYFTFIPKRDAVRNAVSGIGKIMAEESSGDRESTWVYWINDDPWSSNATINNIKAQRTVALDHNMLPHAAWYIELYESSPVQLGNDTFEDGYVYWINVDGWSGEVINLEHCK